MATFLVKQVYNFENIFVYVISYSQCRFEILKKKTFSLTNLSSMQHLRPIVQAVLKQQ